MEDERVKAMERILQHFMHSSSKCDPKDLLKWLLAIHNLESNHSRKLMCEANHCTRSITLATIHKEHGMCMFPEIRDSEEKEKLKTFVKLTNCRFNELCTMCRIARGYNPTLMVNGVRVHIGCFMNIDALVPDARPRDTVNATGNVCVLCEEFVSKELGISCMKCKLHGKESLNPFIHFQCLREEPSGNLPFVAKLLDNGFGLLGPCCLPASSYASLGSFPVAAIVKKCSRQKCTGFVNLASLSQLTHEVGLSTLSPNALAPFKVMSRFIDLLKYWLVFNVSAMPVKKKKKIQTWLVDGFVKQKEGAGIDPSMSDDDDKPRESKRIRITTPAEDVADATEHNDVTMDGGDEDATANSVVDDNQEHEEKHDIAVDALECGGDKSPDSVVIESDTDTVPDGRHTNSKARKVDSDSDSDGDGGSDSDSGSDDSEEQDGSDSDDEDDEEDDDEDDEEDDEDDSDVSLSSSDGEAVSDDDEDVTYLPGTKVSAKTAALDATLRRSSRGSSTVLGVWRNGAADWIDFAQLILDRLSCLDEEDLTKALRVIGRVCTDKMIIVDVCGRQRKDRNVVVVHSKNLDTTLVRTKTNVEHVYDVSETDRICTVARTHCIVLYDKDAILWFANMCGTPQMTSLLTREKGGPLDDFSMMDMSYKSIQIFHREVLSIVNHPYALAIPVVVFLFKTSFIQSLHCDDCYKP